tara:strand:+ start:360 stop:1151 length:792 start_codon:yes stop_codon:yes gene_type:complete
MSYNYSCKYCEYYTDSRSKYNIHLKTKKHQKNYDLENHSNFEYECDTCKKLYKTRQGLRYHLINVCQNINNIEDKVEKIIETNNEILETNKKLLKENEDIKHQLKNNKPTQINNNFNLNVYLNQTCKNAINLTDFLQQITVENADIEILKNEGVEKSIVNVMITALKTLGEFQRPIQCTDLKREIVYVKDENNWEKDNDKKILTDAILRVRDKHIKSLSHYEPHIEEEYLKLHEQVCSDIKTKKISSQILNETTISRGGNTIP